MNRRKTIAPRKLLCLCYALAAVLWVVWCILQSAVMLTYKMKGEMPCQTLTAADLQFDGFDRYDSREEWTAPDERTEWYLSTNNDPHIFWQGRGYLVTVRLEAEHRLPPGGVALYYLVPGETDYSETRKVFASIVDGGYEFDLGGRYVTGLRIDPDSQGGVPTWLGGVVLNPAHLWLLDLLPNGGQWLLLLFGPVLAAAAAALILNKED